MAELSILDVMRDRARFPDTMAWPLDDGTQISLGALRGSLVPQDEVRRGQAQAEETIAALQREKRYLEQMVTQRVAEQPAQGQPTGQQAVYDYSSDPLFKPLWEDIQATKQRAQTFEEQYKQGQALLAQVAEAVRQIPTVLKVQQIQARDPSLDTVGLLQRAAKPVDLDDHYKLLNYDKHLAAEREAGVQAGLERARQDALQNPQVPYAPYGPAQMTPAAPQKFANVQELDQAIMNDADVIRAYLGE